ncbi:MAG TPA: MFS transporter [Bosea sp. (in: a-proteobacteria)]|jgi:DHA2 family multidrug resistance protein|nr:MFS transporter [Bosea sp. (in: a-proteobacteria)]
MTLAASAAPGRSTAAAGTLLVTGVVLAALTEAIAGTVLALGRGDIIGDTAATPDEFAWLDIGYITLKLIGFMTAPWLMSRISPRSLLVAATLAMGLASGIAAMTTRLDLLIGLRLAQGLSGGTLLVAGQALIFLRFPAAHQPLLQALFAMGAVVAPGTLAPALQGWLLDAQAWTWIFYGIVPLALTAAGLLLLADGPMPEKSPRRPFDWLGVALLSLTFFCTTYVLTQGSRWDWFEEPRILWLTLTGAAAFLAFLVQQALTRGRGLIDVSLFGPNDFTFAFIVSFVAGAALSGSAFVIPAFATSVLAFTPSAAGELLLPSGAPFIATLLFAALLFQFRHVPPFATVPLGILILMSGMWLLSGSTSESGADDMMAGVLLRGLGLGFLFLSITLIAFSHLDASRLAGGIGLFNTGRQLGGLMGIAALQTLIEHHTIGNLAVLGANVAAGKPAVIERLAALTAMLAAKGMDAAAAGRAAASLLGRAVTGQSAVIAFDTAFNAVALLFVFAAPILVAIKIGFAKYEKAHAARPQDIRNAG